MAGLRVGQAYGVFFLPGFGLVDYQPPGSRPPFTKFLWGRGVLKVKILELKCEARLKFS